MVEGIVGLVGQGKTLYATYRAVKARDEGRRVVANYYIEGCEYASDWDAVLDATTPKVDAFGNPDRTGALVVIDEANLWCPSRFWNKLDPRLLYAWSQSRKFGIDILWTAQHEARVDTVLREITYQVWVCHGYLGRKDECGMRQHRLFHYKAFMPEEVRKAKRTRLDSRWLLPRVELFSSYNTYQVLELGRSILESSSIEGRLADAPEFRGSQDAGGLRVDEVGREAHWSERRAVAKREKQLLKK